RLSVLAGGKRPAPACKAPEHLRAARTCYDHIAGTIGVTLRDRLAELGWLRIVSTGGQEIYQLTARGVNSLTTLGNHVDSPCRARPEASLRLRVPRLDRAPISPGRGVGSRAAAVRTQ